MSNENHSSHVALRAASSLARLWQSQGKRQEARDLLQPAILQLHQYLESHPAFC